MDELKMTGNCLRGSRGICVFDGAWEESEHLKLMKEMFAHVSRQKICHNLGEFEVYACTRSLAFRRLQGG